MSAEKKCEKISRLDHRKEFQPKSVISRFNLKDTEAGRRIGANSHAGETIFSWKQFQKVSKVRTIKKILE